jgi:hypothetical protein
MPVRTHVRVFEELEGDYSKTNELTTTLWLAYIGK